MSNRDRRRAGAGRDDTWLLNRDVTGGLRARCADPRPAGGDRSAGASRPPSGASESGPRLTLAADRCTLCAVDELPATSTVVPGFVAAGAVPRPRPDRGRVGDGDRRRGRGDRRVSPS